jgi:uncharacterized protein (TIGR01777 family)
MNILIAGGSGFIGQALIENLAKDHQITVLGRHLSKLEATFPENIKKCTWEGLSKLDANHFDAIINLSGRNISEGRWSVDIKKEIIDSRVETTLTLINWAASFKAKPHFYCANAVGIYGLQENGDKEVFTEDSPIEFEAPRDFLAETGTRWQKAAETAQSYDMPLTITRFGVVLQKGQGMLKKLYMPFNLGLGSVIGDGKQGLSWIHIDDLIEAYRFLLHHPELTGAYNLCSPQPVEQKEFAKAFAKTLHRPMFLKTPNMVIRLMLGEMGDNLIIQGQKVAAKKLLEAGFEFKYPNIEQALKKEYGK